MKFSIIIPVFNVEDYIGYCLDSIINNMFEDNIEIICIDDASSDKSLEIIESYQKKYLNIHLYKNSSNKGVAFCRNKGIEMATGEYIWFVDSDDEISPNAFAILNQEIDNVKADVICFNADVFGPDFRAPFSSENYRNSLRCLNHERKNISSFFLITNLWLCCINNNFIKKNNLKFKDNLTVFEDWVFLWYLACFAPSVSYLDLTLYNYRVVVKNSLTKSYREGKETISIFDVWYDVKEKLKLNGCLHSNEQYCLIRANDIFYHFLNHKKYSVNSYRQYCSKYSCFLSEIHNDLFRYIINGYSSQDRKQMRLIRNKPGKAFRAFIYKKCGISKIKQYIKPLILPLDYVFNWLKKGVFFSYQSSVFIFKLILNIHWVIFSFFL